MLKYENLDVSGERGGGKNVLKGVTFIKGRFLGSS